MTHKVKRVINDPFFERDIKKIKHQKTKEHIRKQMEKIIDNPTVGKPLRYNLKNEREVYVKPYRLIYSFIDGTLNFLRFKHHDKAF